MISVRRLRPRDHKRLRRFALSLLIIGALCLAPALVRASTQEFGVDHTVPLSGQWTLSRGDSPDHVSFSLESHGRGWSHSSGSDVPVRELQGLDLDHASNTSTVDFVLKRDAGSFRCHGVVQGREGAGLFTLELDAAYAAALEKRGLGRPTGDEQARLAYADAGFALLDELGAQGYPTPDVHEFLTMAQHGVNVEYVRGMAKLGYRFQTVRDLIRARDHGVDPDFVAELQSAGYSGLSYAVLLSARDHGVDGDYVSGMRGAGYGSLTIAQLQTARDHGVDPRYVSSMAREGYKDLPLESLVRARDHGVDAEFARDVHDRTGRRPPIDELIRLRDRGD